MFHTDEAAFVEVRIHRDLAVYLEALAKEVNSDIATVVSSLVFDGLAHNMLKNLLEEHGTTLDHVVIDFVNRANARDGVPVFVNDEDDSDVDEDDHDSEEVTLELEGSNGENQEVDVKLEE